MTGIGTLDTTTGELSFDGWYTMDGVRLESKPTTKGISINNGKKIVIKREFGISFMQLIWFCQ